MENKFMELSENIIFLDNKIESLKSEKKSLELERREFCSHEKIEQSGGKEWFDYYEMPNHGMTDLVLRCLDCGLCGTSMRYINNEDNPNYLVYEKLHELVQKRRVIIR